VGGELHLIHELTCGQLLMVRFFLLNDSDACAMVPIRGVNSVLVIGQNREPELESGTPSFFFFFLNNYYFFNILENWNQVLGYLVIQ
jgi:hypothetical protein